MRIEKGFTDNWLQPTGAQETLMRQVRRSQALCLESCALYRTVALIVAGKRCWVVFV